MFQRLFQRISNFFFACFIFIASALVALLAPPAAVYAQGTDPLSVVLVWEDAQSVHDVDAELALRQRRSCQIPRPRRCLHRQGADPNVAGE